MQTSNYSVCVRHDASFHNTLSLNDVSVQLTVDVVNEARCPRYVVHRGIMFICVVPLYNVKP